MSKIELINDSCADQEVDAVVNTSNSFRKRTVYEYMFRLHWFVAEIVFIQYLCLYRNSNSLDR